MTDSPPSHNITRVKSAPSIPVAGNGQSHKENASRNVKIASAPIVRQIAPLTRYSQESGMAEPIDDMGALPQEDEAPHTSRPAPQAQPSDPDRHSKWKEEQKAKREARETQKHDKAVKSQALAKDLLRKGDLVGAANAMGMSPSDLAAFVDNARLQVPNPEPKPLSPEEQRVADETKFREEVLAFKEEQKQFNYRTVANKYIQNKIDPVLADKDKFEYIHTADVNSIKDYAYEYMNKHFAETGEELNAQDVLETIENEMFNSHVAALERGKGIKKVAKYFAPPVSESLNEEPESQLTGDEPELHGVNDYARIKTPSLVRRLPIGRTDRSFAPEAQEERQEEAHEEVALPPSNLNVNEVRRRTNPGVQKSWRSMTRQEQLAVLRREQEEEDRKARR